MKDLKHLLNKIAREQHFTTALQTADPCAFINGYMDDILGSTLGRGRRLTALDELTPRLHDIKMKLWNICDPDWFDTGLNAALDAILILIQEALCILSWLGGVQGTVLRLSLEALHLAIRAIRRVADNPSGLTSALAVACKQIHTTIITMDGLDILEELGIDEGPTTFQVQPTPVACPQINEGWIRDFLNQYDGIGDDMQEILVYTLLAMAVAFAAALAAAALISSAAVAAVTASWTAAIQSAIAWLIGEQAAVVAAGLVGAISATCIADDTDIGVEEEVKEWTCCLPGGAEPEEGWDEDDCLNNGGELFGPMHMCQIDTPGDEK